MSTPSRRPRSRVPARGTALNRAVGGRLRRARLAAGMTATELAGRGYTRAHVSAIELGKISASLEALAHFAHELGIPLRQLIPPEK